MLRDHRRMQDMFRMCLAVEVRTSAVGTLELLMEVWATGPWAMRASGITSMPLTGPAAILAMCITSARSITALIGSAFTIFIMAILDLDWALASSAGHIPMATIITLIGRIRSATPSTGADGLRSVAGAGT